MKAISLWQPWATLMAIGSKRNETRSWPTSHRGPLAIHAAKKWDGHLKRLCTLPPYNEHLSKFDPDDLPRGAIVCVVNVIDCVKITDTNAPIDDENNFGDYTPGRFMWITNNVRRLPEAVPFVGAQWFFDVPDDLIWGDA